MRKMKLFLEVDFSMKLLFLEAYLLMGWARLLKNKDFSKIASSLALVSQVETSPIFHPTNKGVIKQVSSAIEIMSKYTFWESQCLVKALTALKMLEKRNIESTLFLGTGKDENGNLIAHAWLRSGPFIVTGAEGMNDFTVVGKFAKFPYRKTNEGESIGEQFEV